MPRTDAAELIASKLDRLPLPDGREYRFLSFSTFGQAEDTKARVGELAKDVGEGIVHLLESHGYTLGHPSDPAKELPAGKRIAVLMCAQCGDPLGQLGIDDSDAVTVHPVALRAMSDMEHHCA